MLTEHLNIRYEILCSGKKDIIGSASYRHRVERLRTVTGMAESFECGAFMEKFTVQPSPSPVDHQHKLLLSGLTFAVKDMSISKYGNRFDLDGYETGFENPDWARTQSAATSTVPAMLDILWAGANCVGKTMIDEMADGHEFRKNHTEWINKVNLI